jgi:hypothetical protein
MNENIGTKPKFMQQTQTNIMTISKWRDKLQQNFMKILIIMTAKFVLTEFSPRHKGAM